MKENEHPIFDYGKLQVAPINSYNRQLNEVSSKGDQKAMAGNRIIAAGQRVLGQTQSVFEIVKGETAWTRRKDSLKFPTLQEKKVYRMSLWKR